MAKNDFSTVTFGSRVTKPVRTVFGVLALFERGHQGQFYLADGTPIGPTHMTLGGAIAYAAKKGWKVEPIDVDEESAEEQKEDAPEHRAPMPTVPDSPTPMVVASSSVEVPSRVRPKPARRMKRGK